MPCWPTDATQGRAADHVASFERAFGAPPGTWSPYTYDSVMLLAAMAEQAGGFEAEALTTALNQVDGWQGWTGPVTFDPSSGNREPATVVMVRTDADGTLHVDGAWAQAVGAPYGGGE